MSLDAKKTYARTLEGLRDSLFDELEDLRQGVSAPHEAIAFSNLARQIVNTADIEIRRSELMIKARALRLREKELGLSPPSASELLLTHQEIA